MSSDRKEVIKIKEFEWYEVETKVRQIMGQLLQPFNKKQTQEGIKINEIKRNMAALSKKIEEHDFLLQQENAQKPTYIQLQDDKIQEIAIYAKQSQLENEGKLRKMEAIINIYQQKIKQLNSLESRIDQEILLRAQQFKKYKKGIDKEIDLMTKRLDSQVQEMTQFKGITKSAVSKMESRMIVFDNRLKELEDDVRHKGSDIRKLYEEASSHNERIVKVEIKVADINSRLQDREKDAKLSQKFFSKIRQVEIDIKFLATFLQQYQPLYTQMQISDALNSFVQGRQRRKLCVFEQSKFAKLHYHILMNERISLQEMMASFTSNIRKIINRNKKFVISLAVKESIKYGTNVYEFRMEDNIDKEEDEKQKTNNVVIPEEDIAKIVNQHLEVLREETKRVMQDEIKSTKTWMKELQEQMLLRSLEYDNKYEEVKKKISEGEVKFQLQSKTNSQDVARLKNKQGSIESQLEYARQSIKDILNFGSVINHIVIQDQIDRQGTALYALRASKKNDAAQMPTLQLDPNCVSCDNKNTSIVQQAFKMACLTYNPSQIRIDEQLFSREEILQISTSILQKLKKKLWTGQNQKLGNNERESMVLRKGSNHATISVTIGGEVRRQSSSLIKEPSLTAKETPRSRQMQTLLPMLGASRRERRDKKAQFSVFY